MSRKSLILAGVSLSLLWSGTAFAADDPVRVYTHGEGQFGLLQPDGSLKGPGVDLLRCTMQGMGQAYELATASMVRSERLITEGRDHIWFPTYDDGDPERKARLVGPIGHMAIYWFTPGGGALTPDQPDFKAKARVTAFPGSRPEAILKKEGYQWLEGSDDENRLLLMLLEGRVDAILSADFRDTLTAGAQELARNLRVDMKVNLPVAFELSAGFNAQHPGFQARMQQALDQCRTVAIPERDVAQ